MSTTAERSLSPSTAQQDDRYEFFKPVVTTQQLVMYAGASGDYNRIHYDHHFAVEAGLGGVIAHGMLTMGFLGQAVTSWARPESFVTSIRARFVHPVRPGDEVRFEGVVIEASGEEECALDVQGYVDDRLVIVGAARLATRSRNVS